MRAAEVACVLIRRLAAAIRPAQSSAQARLRRTDLVFAASASVLRGTNTNEVMASAKVGRDEATRRRGFDVKSSVVIDENRQIERPELPCARLSCATGAGRSHLLSVRNEAGISDMESLRGKRVSYYSATTAGPGRKWRKVTLNEGRPGRAERFPGCLTAAAKPWAACPPVFIEKADARVIGDRSFHRSFPLSSVPDPRLERKMRVIATSPEFVETLAAADAQCRPSRGDLRNGLLELRLDSEGRQILVVLRGDRTSILKTERLEPVRQLKRKCQADAASERGLPEERRAVRPRLRVKSGEEQGR